MSSTTGVAEAANLSSDSGTPAPAPATRGAFIVLEGLDRSGKTTQVKLLQTRFVEAGKEVKVMRFPGKPSDALLRRFPCWLDTGRGGGEDVQICCDENCRASNQALRSSLVFIAWRQL